MIGGDDLAVARTPLRLSLGGGGTDLPLYADRFGGDMITAAISLVVTVVARRGRLDGHFRFSHDRTELVGAVADFEDRYMRAALDMTGMREPCEVTSLGPVPSGTGLGSSGAFAVSLLAALHALQGRRLPREELAEQAFELEAVRLGMPVGRQDPYACALGGLRRLRIHRSGAVEAARLRVPADTERRLAERLLLFYTGRRRDSSNHLTPPRGGRATDERLAELHTVRALGDDVRRALERDDLDRIPAAMRSHWDLKRRHGGNAQWDDDLREAYGHGAQAGKLVGAGGGGFLLLYVDPSRRGDVVRTLPPRGLRHVPFTLVTKGTTVSLLRSSVDRTALVGGTA